EPLRVVHVRARARGDAHPEEERRVAALELEPGVSQERLDDGALRVEDLPALLGVLVVRPRGGRGLLDPDRARDADVRPELRERGDRARVARDEPRAIARHARALRARVEREDVLLAELEHRARPLRRPDVDVALVRTDQHIALDRIFRELLEILV